jgi:LPS export ABC transporter protein LptC
MRINRKTSYLLSFLIVLTFFGIGALFLQVKDPENPPSPLPSPTLSPLPSSEETPTPREVPLASSSPHSSPLPPEEEDTTLEDGGFALNNFHRSETRADGSLLWEVVGTNARYFPEENRVDVEECVFSMVDDKGKQVILRAGKAQLIITGPELESGKFSSEVILEYGNGMRIITPHATYAHKKGSVTTSAHVKVVGSWYMIEGDGLRADLNKEHYELLNNVSSVLEPSRRKKQENAS